MVSVDVWQIMVQLSICKHMSSPNLGLGNSPTISLLEGRRRLEFSICSFVKFDSFLWSKSMSLYLIGKKRKEKTNPWRIVCLEWFERLLSNLVIGRLLGNENDCSFYFYFLFFIFIYSLLEFDSLLRSRSFNWLLLGRHLFCIRAGPRSIFGSVPVMGITEWPP